ncbi:diguanylate cyclase [Scleromatobacter humisilvae]|uniref:diguanylate cyclase n=1 Tax=Scleromatobacter humisilvae TaxID=2897159 RepID=A0A9X1YLP2_9BURK|nr:diguanylate cyclase [Scleromatobacter humisilvae]MCK9688619.1 diguanylate cyclase [Scleromatobacter humisilvae]
MSTRRLEEQSPDLASLEFLVDDDALMALELMVAGGDASPEAFVALAWQLRQRNPARALVLADDAEARFGGWPADARRGHAARLQLVCAEADWLAGRLDAAASRAHDALQSFDAVADARGRADAHWMRAMLAIDRGDWPGKDAELQAMAEAARGLDASRVDIAEAAQAYFAAFRDSSAAHARWGARFAAGRDGLSVAAACWVEDFRAVCAHHASDFVPAIRHFARAYTLALASGQPRRAVIAATNTGDSLNHLNDYPAALDWMQRGLELARSAGGPGAMGVALLQTAHTLRLLDRLDASREMLQEALELMAPLAASRNHAYAMWQLVEVELAATHFADALAVARGLVERADALRQSDLQSHARCGQARALLALGQPAQALAAAEAALRHGEGAPNLQVAALRVMADVHALDVDRALPAPPGVEAPSVALHVLLRALALADGIARFTVPGELLDAIAREYARLGDYVQAYAFSQRAGVSRETSRSQEARNRAVAMQVTHETERAQAEAEHQRSLARAQAERLETLERLGTIGREITRNLEPSAILAALDLHVRALLDATSLVIHRVSADGRELVMIFGVEAGAPLPPHRIAVDDPRRPAARCARERRELMTGGEPDADGGEAAGVGGTGHSRSVMCAPLSDADRLLGVMSIGADRPRAYAERELAIFRTLCAYGAIALANADAQAQLVRKNAQLEQLSVSDTLTGLSNRLRLDQVLADEAARNARSGAPVSVILLDLDHFKSVNDQHGHLAGDRVLTTIGELLKASSRRTDEVGRWGGEEFLVVCRDTDVVGVRALAQHLRERIAAHDFKGVGHRTASFGVAQLADGEDVESLVARADVALYRAKRGGRNRVEAG